MATRTLAIMFTDIKGFTARTSGESRAELVHLLDEHDKLLRPVFAHFHGTVVKTIGDAFLVWFASPTDAVVCGVTIQEVLRKHNATASERDRLEVRISINIGDVEIRADEASGQTDVFGEAVNLASRLEGITEAGEVWFTEAVYLTMNRHETPTTEVGERTFKGIPHPVRVYKVLFDPKSDQLARIAEAVRIENGVPVLEGLAVGADAPGPASVAAPVERATAVSGTRTSRGRGRGPRWGVVYAGLAVVLAAAGGLYFWKDSRDRAAAIAEVQALIDQGKFADAITRADRELAVHHDDPKVIAVGVRAEEALLDEKGREMTAAQALDWIRDETARRPWAAQLRGAVPRLEAMDAAFRMRDDPQAEVDVEKVIAKYPNDATVPYTIASIVSRPPSMPQYSLKWFELALERGGYAGDEHIRKLCEETFQDFSPRAAWTATCHRIEKKWYAKDRVLWAEKHLDEGNANEFLNAWEILHEEKRPEPDTPLHRDLHDFLSGVKDDAVEKRLLAERDPETRRRIADLVRTGRKDGTFEVGEDDRMAAFLAKMEK